MAAARIEIKGLDDLVRSFRRLDKDLTKEIQRGLQEAARPVAEAAKSKLGKYRGAATGGIRPRVKGATAIVEQRKGKVTGKRGDFGTIIMQKALIPARTEQADHVVKHLERVIDRLGGEEGLS